MKLSFIKVFTILSLVLLFSGCENFLAGSKLVDQLEKEIKYANAQDIEIYIAPELNQGTTNPNGTSKKKIGYEFDVKFTEAANYQFYKWVAVNSDTGKSYEDKVVFENEKTTATTVTVSEKVSNLWIKPVCYIRPDIEKKMPEMMEEGVSRDSSIILTFTNPLAEDNDFSKVEITVGENDVSSSFKTAVLNGKILTISADKEKLIAVADGTTKTVTVKIPADFYYVENDVKISMGKEFIFSYKINGTTNNKAEIIFSEGGESGTVTPNGTVNYNIGDSFKLSYEPKTGYCFTGWNILDSDGNEVSEDVLKVDNKSSATTNITVLKDEKGISITPNYVVLPAVANHSPETSTTAINANIAIEAEFNMPIDESYINFSNIYIMSGGENISRFFNEPELSEDGKTIRIQPKALELVQFIKERKLAFMEVSVTIADSIKSEIDNVKYSIVQNDKSSWNFRYKPEVENVAPQKIEFEVSKTIPENLTSAIASGNLISQKTFSAFTDADFYTNHIKDKVYITGRYFDADTKIASVLIEEVRTNDKNANVINRSEADGSYDFITTYTAAGEEYPLNVTYDADGYATFAIPYTLKSKADGAVKITVQVLDSCNNHGEPQEFTVLKDTVLDLSEVMPFNCVLPFMTGAVSTYEEDVAAYNAQKDFLKIKSSGDGALVHKFYGSYADKTDDLIITYEYEGKNGKETGNMTWDTSDLWWNVKLNVNELNNLKVKLNVQNKEGLSADKELVFPKKAVVLNVKKPESTDFKHNIVNVVSENTNTVLIKSSGTYDIWQYAPEILDSIGLTTTRIYKEQPACVISAEGNLFGDLAEIDVQTLKGNDASDKVIKIKNVEYKSCGEASGLYDVTINLDDNFFEDFMIGTMSLKTQSSLRSEFSNYDYSPVYFTLSDRKYSYTFRRCYRFLKDCDIAVTAYDYEGNVTKTPDRYGTLYDYGINGKLDTLYNSPDLKDNAPPELTRHPAFIDVTNTKGINNTYIPKGMDELNDPLNYFAIPAIRSVDTTLKKLNIFEKFEIVDPIIEKNKGYIEQKQIYDGSAYYRIFLAPDYDLEDDEGEVTIKVTDSGNLSSQITVPYKTTKLPVPSVDYDGDTLEFYPDKAVANYFYQKVYIDTLTTNEDYPWDKTIYNYPAIGDAIVLSVSDYEIPTDTYVRVGVLAALEESNAPKAWGTSPYRYLYTGSNPSIQNYVEGPSSIMIQSDKDVRVQVIQTMRPYSECKKWEIEDWQYRRETIEDKLITFNGEETKYYYIPKSIIDDGACYVTIIYFGDKKVMTSVYQN